MDGCYNREWGGERGRLAGMGSASKCMRHRSYSKMHKCSLFRSYTHTHTRTNTSSLLGFDCFPDNSIVFSGIRGAGLLRICLCEFDPAVKSLLVKLFIAGRLHSFVRLALSEQSRHI